MVKAMSTDTKDARQQEAALQIFIAARDYLSSYFEFSDPMYASIGALWAMATHFLPSFDAFGYLVITAALKRCGKTRFAESIAALSRTPNLFTAMTKATMFHAIGAAGERGTTIMFDESEELSSESSDMRPVLNVGAYRGIGVPRLMKVEGEMELVNFEVFGGKIFVLIGDVFDTLRDRSIVIEMTRKQPKKPYFRTVAQAEAKKIAANIEPLYEALEADDTVRKISYEILTTTEFLESRELEMWTPILCMARLTGNADLIRAVNRVAADLASEKQTTEKKLHHDLRAAEGDQVQNDFSELLLKHVVDLMHRFGDLGAIASADLVQLLKDIETAPWRKFRGVGIDQISLQAMLRPFGIGPVQFKFTKGPSKGKNLRSYRKDQILKAIQKHPAYDSFPKAKG